MSALLKTYSILKDTYHARQSLPDNDMEKADQIKRDWGQHVFQRLNIDIEKKGLVSEEPGTLFLGNHVSYLDIPLLLGMVKGLSFVAKHEVSRWPIIGKAATRINTVYVKRGKESSRKAAAEAVKESILTGKRIVVFPSGTTSITTQKQWRKGAFEIAASTNCWVQPFRVSYTPLRSLAYIDDDFFPTHLYRLFSLEKIHNSIEFHEPVKINDPIKDCQYWQQWAQKVLEPTH